MTASQGTAVRLLDAGPRYRPLKALGQGSFGAVYRARLEGSEQEVALKALTRVKPEALTRFKREFRALAELNHPNLVALRELFEHDGQWFIAMELVEGTDLLSWVRRSANDNGFDEGRVRKTFADVAQGLAALHAHGLLHRDLKPSNVRVTPEGKAVVLDFGLVTVSDEEQQSTQRNGVGTLAYMAPEQMSGERLGPAADLYALGASLYEALTGRLPHQADTPFALMLRKANEDPEAPRQVSPHVPPELDTLCMALLERSPRLRPSLEAALRVLLGASEPKPSFAPAHSSASEDGAAFEGRSKELKRLAEALARTHEGEPSLVFVEGESGIGKSALIAEFTRRQLEAEPRTWVLSGRCYEHERVPYKAFDACIDALAKRLGKLAPELCSAVLPPRAGLLKELFPVLAAVKACSEDRALGAPAEPTARRLAAFDVLAALLDKLAQSRPLLIVIDDLQWADEESLRLLRHLVHERPAPVLLIASVRPDAELSAGLIETLVELRQGSRAQRIALRGLPVEAVEALARKLLGAQSSRRALGEIAYESDGHPMLVAELCYYAKAHGGPAQNLSLDAALSARLSTLTAGARRLLELLALCSRPHQEGLFRDLGLAVAFDDVVKELLAQRFVHRAIHHRLAIAHDRVRRAVLAELEPARRRGQHRALAEALEAKRQGEPSELAGHWQQAGEAARAGALYLSAAQLALQTLAFGSAAEHYARAFALLGDDASPERGALLTQQGRALAGAGRSAEAALAFTEAAQRVAGAERVRLRVLAAQHELQSGQFDAGICKARAVLSDLGIALPKGRTGALTRIAWERALLRLRGTKVHVASEFDPQEQLRLDAMTALTFPLWWADFLPGNALTIMHVRRALALGELGHAACALAQEGTLRAIMSNHDATPALFALAGQLAERSQLPSARARVLLGEGVAATLRSENELALTKYSAAEELLVSSCPEESWLLSNVRVMLVAAFAGCGRFREQATSFKRWFGEARERRDLFAETALVGLGCGHLVWLMDDRPEEALAALESSLRPWQARPTDMVLIGELIGRPRILAYAGSTAHPWLREQRARHERTFLLQRGEGRTNWLFSRALAALQSSAEARGGRRGELLAEAEALAGVIARDGMGTVLRGLVLAQVLACKGESDRALALARETTEFSRARGLGLYAQNLEYLCGVLEGGEGGQQRCRAVLAFFREQGWKDPWRAATMHAPAVRVLEGEEARPVASSAPLLLGRYRPSEPLPASARDAFTDALDTRTGRTVTLRSLGRVGPAALALLKEELRAQESVHHPNWARIEALHEHEGSLIVVLEPLPRGDLLAFVRGDGPLDCERLRSALAQVLTGLAALHESGASHGELRPSLVRVNEEGRVVLLGRGSLAEGETDREPELDDLSYLAPEQLVGGAPSPAADVYALGTVVYQVLTGQLPFAQPTVAKLREAKQRGRAVPPWALRIEVPSELEELCLAMLERDPVLRPSLPEAEARLSGSREAGEAARTARRAKALASLIPASQSSAVGQRSFFGRAQELETLEAALSRAESGAQALVCVQGEGGIGKTALVNEALEQLRARAAHALVLPSRCYANEQLRFQAFDGAVDELSRALNKLPSAELEAVLPPRAVLLAQLFPVLASVPSIRGATKKGVPAEPGARRAAAIEAFVALLLRLAQRAPLVLVIDDLQWADAESFALLGALLGAGADLSSSHAPLAEEEGGTRAEVSGTGTLGAGIAIVAMLRPNEARDEAVRAGLAGLLARQDLVSLTLDKLSATEALPFARRLFGTKPSDAELLLAVRESGGHPLFLRELAQARSGAGSELTLSLEQALRARVALLRADARGLLELLALLARPCPAHVLERAAGLGQAFDDALRGLLRSELIQRRGPLGLACFHDRLREVVAKHVARERTPGLCAQLAEALEAEAESDAAERARLWEAAGDTSRACEAYGAAGDRALDALTFGAAERLYARALDLLSSQDDGARVRLLAQRGHALVALGRSADAALLFEQAAQRASGPDAIRLRVWAAQHQLQSAQFEEGMRNTRAVLRELDIQLPEGPGRALSRLVWERALLALRGTNVAVRQDILASDKLWLDAMQQLAIQLCWIDIVPGLLLNTMHLRRALALGEPNHAAWALTQEGVVRSLLDDHEKSRALFAKAEQLAAHGQVPATLAFVQHTQANAAFVRAELAHALEKALLAEEIFSTSCPEEGWCLTNVRVTIGLVLVRYGDFLQLASSTKRWFAEAEARKDAFAQVSLFGFGFGHMAWLMEDRPAELAEIQERVMLPCRVLPPGYAQAGEVFVRMNLGDYLGGTDHYEWFRAQRAAHQRSLLLKQGETQLVLLYAHTIAAFAARAGATPARKAELLAEAAHTIKGIRPKAFGAVFRPIALAQLLALEGRTEAALSALREAREACQRNGDETYGQSAAYLQGVIEGGDGGRALREASLAFYRERGWKDPWRGVTMWVPAARELEGKLG